MRGSAKLICTPLPRQEVQARAPALLGPLDLFDIRETLAGMAVDTLRSASTKLLSVMRSIDRLADGVAGCSAKATSFPAVSRRLMAEPVVPAGMPHMKMLGRLSGVAG